MSRFLCKLQVKILNKLMIEKPLVSVIRFRTNCWRWLLVYYRTFAYHVSAGTICLKRWLWYKNWRSNHQESWKNQVLRWCHRCLTRLVQTQWRNEQEGILSYWRSQTSAAFYFERNYYSNLLRFNCTAFWVLQPGLGLFQRVIEWYS